MMSILAELWAFQRVPNKYWFTPILFMLLVFGVLIILAQSTALAPFVQMLF